MNNCIFPFFAKKFYIRSPVVLAPVVDLKSADSLPTTVVTTATTKCELVSRRRRNSRDQSFSTTVATKARFTYSRNSRIKTLVTTVTTAATKCEPV